MVVFILVISEIDDFRENVKNKLPQGVHRTIDGIFDQMKHSEEICGPISEILIITPLSEIVSQLNTGEIKPVRAMKNLTQLLPWIKLFSDGIMNGIEIDPSLDEQSIKKMKKAYLLEVGSGKKVTLQSVLKTAAYSDCSFKPEPEIDFKDITTSNIIMALSEILANIEMMIEDIIQGSTEKIKDEKYDSVDIASISREGKWALQEIQEGRATHSTIPNIIFIKKKEINRALEIYRLFKPILKTAHIVVSSMPIFLTMLYEKPEKCNELLDDCNNIFTEFTCGAQLERLSISLKEKIGKNRSIEEIEINAAAITKNLKKIIDGLNIHILSNLRRMQVKTIISDKTFYEAKEIGIDFTGLACKFGIEHAPDYFDDIKLESTRLFSKETLDYTILVRKRLHEETSQGFTPNLKMMDNLIRIIRRNVEKNFLIVPSHIAPLYGGSLINLTQEINELNLFLTALKFYTLTALTKEKSDRMNFYSELKKYYNNIEDAFVIFNDFLTLGLKLVTTDQNLAISLSKVGGIESKHSEGYPGIFEKSLRNVKLMLSMNTLTQNEASRYKQKIISAREFMKDFTSNHSAKEIRKIMNMALKISI